jgi:two-component system cell cycle sensor histidine kinase/response regulator CckA
MRVLLIEDSVFATKHVQKMLSEVKSPQFGAELYCVDRISAGLEYLANNEIDVILLDLTLPDSQGIDTLMKICTRVPEVPVVVLTGLGDEMLAKEAVQKGAQDYLVKGQINSNLLRRSILYSIERKKVERELKKYRDHLEELVKERTAELTTVNNQLKQEVTERKQAEQAVKSSALRYRRLFEAAKDGILILSKESGVIEDVNPYLVELLGYSKEDFLGKQLWEIGAFKDIKLAKSAFKILQKENYIRYEDLPLKAKGGRLIDVEFVSNVYDVDHKRVIQCNIRNITERKQAEKALENSFNELKKVHQQLEQSQSQLIQVEKMSAVGTLAAGIAHELNNPLMAILNFTSYCLKHTGKDDKRYSFLEDIEREAGRCIEIVSNLLTFSRSEQDGEEQYQSESLARIINRVVRIMSYRIEKEKVSLSTHIAESTPQIWVKVGSIQQVILNLLTNALDAVEESQEKEIRIEVHPDGDSVCLSVADSGKGVAPEIMNKIYDPFFTTKPVGKGTGLGLSISRNIIESHGGDITCESKAGVGTVFKITLPINTNRRG